VINGYDGVERCIKNRRPTVDDSCAHGKWDAAMLARPFAAHALHRCFTESRWLNLSSTTAASS
jgi:hypothetical protein